VLLVWVSLMGIPALPAQTLLADSMAQQYPFLRPAENMLRFPGGDSAWQVFFNRLHDLETDPAAQIRILHIGGSHVQGGTFHERIRLGMEDLLTSPRGVSPGFFFPYVLAETNAPGFMTVHATGKWEGERAVKKPEEGPYGISALQAITGTPFASVLVTLRHPRKGFFKARTLRIYYDMEASTLVPEPFSFDCPDSILTDSLAGYVEWRYEQPQEALDLVLLPTTPAGEDAEEEPRFVLLGMEFLDPEPALIAHMIGANGASLRTYLECALFEAQAAALRADLVLFGIGVNDANGPNGRFDQDAFEARYAAMIRIFRQANPEVVFLFITNNDTWYKKRQVNRNVFRVVESMDRLAARHQAAVWDQFAVMGGLNSIVSWQRAGLAKSDRIHFTSSGYTLVGQLLSEAFHCAYMDHLLHTATQP
jgi:lysophospholipase L1-like esterase